MKTAVIFGIIVLLGFLAVYMITNPRTQERLTETIFTPTPIMPTGTNQPETTPLPTATPVPTVAARSQRSAESATIRTDKGVIEVEFYPDDAPKTVTNFATHADNGYYDNLTFHRVEAGFVVQGGDPNGDGTGGYSIYGETFEDELNPETDSYKAGYKEGVIAMANRGPDTNGSQFFIMLADNDQLPKLYTIFGKVTEGMDVVKSITPGDKILSIELE